MYHAKEITTEKGIKKGALKAERPFSMKAAVVWASVR